MLLFKKNGCLFFLISRVLEQAVQSVQLYRNKNMEEADTSAGQLGAHRDTGPWAWIKTPILGKAATEDEDYLYKVHHDCWGKTRAHAAATAGHRGQTES